MKTHQQNNFTDTMDNGNTIYDTITIDNAITKTKSKPLS